MIRGINVSGCSKLPERELDGVPSFVGRPFPLDEAREHFRRLHGWGFHLVRLLTTWEAIEPVTPGRYDREYLRYYRRLVEIAGEEGLRVVVDPHQDVWSRLSGGDGAPRWTVELAGFDPAGLRASGAALYEDQYAGNPAGAVWAMNHDRLACATMFTLFFGGDTFAPKLQGPGGGSFEKFLQRHYIGAMCALAQEVSGCRNVVGFGVMNEPGMGFIGRDDLTAKGVFTLDVAPTPLEAMASGAGVPWKVKRFRLGPLGPVTAGRETLNAEGASAWDREAGCPWREHGVWGLDDRGHPVVLREEFFSSRPDGSRVDFANDHYRPFVERYAKAIRGINPRWLVFVETPVLGELPDWNGNAPLGIVDGSHWYDVATVVTRRYRSWLNVDKDTRQIVVGGGPVRRMFDRQFGKMISDAEARIGKRPLWVSEFGTPFNGHTGNRWRDFSDESRAMDAYFEALEGRGLSYALWQYDPRSRRETGDGWNDEEFSIWSHDLGSSGGARTLDAVVRPYPCAVQGRVLGSRFDSESGRYALSYHADPAIAEPTLVFVPEHQFGGGFEVRVSGAGKPAFSTSNRLLVIPAAEAGTVQLEIRRRAVHSGEGGARLAAGI